MRVTKITIHVSTGSCPGNSKKSTQRIIPQPLFPDIKDPKVLTAHSKALAHKVKARLAFIAPGCKLISIEGWNLNEYMAMDMETDMGRVTERIGNMNV